jgi:hypothetical protein
MEFLNPQSLKLVEAFVEPSLKGAKIGERFQFQRIGYFSIDKDSTEGKLVFNKTVGLRDSWEKQKQVEKTNTNQTKPQNKSSQPERKAIDVIQQLGKKYTNLPEEKQQKAKSDIQELAKSVSYEELQPLFNTAAKKVGTRIAVTIVLDVLLKDGLQINSDINEFIEKALEDENELLKARHRRDRTLGEDRAPGPARSGRDRGRRAPPPRADLGLGRPGRGARLALAAPYRPRARVQRVRARRRAIATGGAYATPRSRTPPPARRTCPPR